MWVQTQPVRATTTHGVNKKTGKIILIVICDLVSLSACPLSVGKEHKSTHTAHCSFRVGDVKPPLCGLCISYGERGLLPAHSNN